VIPLDSIRRAAAALEGVAVRTPLVTIPASALPGPPVAGPPGPSMHGQS